MIFKLIASNNMHSEVDANFCFTFSFLIAFRAEVFEACIQPNTRIDYLLSQLMFNWPSVIVSYRNGTRLIIEPKISRCFCYHCLYSAVLHRQTAWRDDGDQCEFVSTLSACNQSFRTFQVPLKPS